jgi:hypothetical protein
MNTTRGQTTHCIGVLSSRVHIQICLWYMLEVGKSFIRCLHNKKCRYITFFLHAFGAIILILKLQSRWKLHRQTFPFGTAKSNLNLVNRLTKMLCFSFSSHTNFQSFIQCVVQFFFTSIFFLTRIFFIITLIVVVVLFTLERMSDSYMRRYLFFLI